MWCYMWCYTGLCKLVQMDSSMTADDVIVVMLKKMRISSPKSKFALYELDRDSKRSRRLHKTEEPLVLQLLWGTARTNVCRFLCQHCNRPNSRANVVEGFMEPCRSPIKSVLGWSQNRCRHTGLAELGCNCLPPGSWNLHGRALLPRH